MDKMLYVIKIIILSSLVLLSACGGEVYEDNALNSTAGGEGGIIGTAKVVVQTGSKVEAKSKSGLLLNSPINEKGNYQLPEANTETYLLKTIDAQEGKEYYSIAHSDGDNTITRNLHSYTDLILRNWFATQNINIDDAFSGSQPISKLPSVSEINAIEKEI